MKHKPSVAPVQCSSCHHEGMLSDVDTIHKSIPKDKVPPKCQDCHGSHYIMPKENRASSVFPATSERMCAKCHADSEAVKTYHSGIHGMSKEKGGAPIAGCTDCHRGHIPGPTAMIHGCESCHSKEFGDYFLSNHYALLRDGDPRAPQCTTCHGGHDIRFVSDPESPAYPTKVPSTCSKCHDDSKTMQGFDLPTDRLRTYRDSYHGIANEQGNLNAPTCATCHGNHQIRPSDDPASTVSALNLPAVSLSNLSKTCGRCHEDMSANVARGKVHVIVAKQENAILYYVSEGFKWLTILTMAALIGHICLDLFARARRRLRRKR
jgi:DnaJ-class molecular chaperone